MRLKASVRGVVPPAVPAALGEAQRSRTGGTFAHRAHGRRAELLSGRIAGDRSAFLIGQPDGLRKHRAFEHGPIDELGRALADLLVGRNARLALGVMTSAAA